MADLRYVTPNRLRRRAERNRGLTLAAGILAGVLAAAIHPLLLIAVVALAAHFWRRQGGLLKGAEGEELALGVPILTPGSLATLPDDYCIFTQVRVPTRNRAREIDAVVVGPTGIFAIEVKHYCGELRGAEADVCWSQCCGPNGARTKAVGNPALQAKTAAAALGRYLRTHGIATWVEPAVVFTHSVTRLVLQGPTSVPLLRVAGLATWIRDHRAHTPFTRQGAAVRAMRLLVDPAFGHASDPDNSTAVGSNGSATRRANGPEHIRCFMRDFVTNRVADIMAHRVSPIGPGRDTAKPAPAAPAQRAAAPVPAHRRIHRRSPPARWRLIRGGLAGARRWRRTWRLHERTIEMVEEPDND